MKVWIEPLRLHRADGPVVYIVIRQVGKHKDIEEAKVDTLGDAVRWASARWSAPIEDIQVKDEQFIELGGEA